MIRSTAAAFLAVAALSGTACGSPDRAATLDAEAMGAAVREAIAEPSRLDRTQRLTELFAQLDANNLPGALAVVEVNQYLVDDAELELFVEGWARFDPVAAVAHLPNWKPHRTKAAVAAAIRGWAFQDPEAVVAELERLKDEFPRLESLMRENLILGWVPSGQPGALDAVAARPATFWPYAVPPLVKAHLRARGTEGALAWANEVFAKEIDDGLRDALLRNLVQVTAPRDPALVASWLEPHLDRPYAIAGPRLVVNTWIQQDSDAATAWLEEHAPPEDRSDLLFGAVERWCRMDFARARPWVEDLPAEPRYDPAFHAYAAVASRRAGAGASAMRIAEQIEDPERRAKALRVAAMRWHRRDREAAEAWLEASELDEEAREEIRGGPNS